MAASAALWRRWSPQEFTAFVQRTFLPWGDSTVSAILAAYGSAASSHSAAYAYYTLQVTTMPVSRCGLMAGAGRRTEFGVARECRPSHHQNAVSTVARVQ